MTQWRHTHSLPAPSSTERTAEYPFSARRGIYIEGRGELSKGLKMSASSNDETAEIIYHRAMEVAEAKYRRTISTPEAKRLENENFERFDRLADDAWEIYLRECRAAKLAFQKAIKDREREAAAPAKGTADRITSGPVEDWPDTVISVEDAACELQVTVRDLQAILKPKQAEWDQRDCSYYECRDIELLKRIAADPTQPECFLIRLMQDHKQFLDGRLLKSQDPLTLTGKVKKNFQKKRQPEASQPAYRNCPDCGNPLTVKIESDLEYPDDEDDHGPSEWVADWRKAADRGNRARNVTVEYKGRKKGPTNDVRPDVDQAVKNAAATKARPEPRLVRYEVYSCKNCGYEAMPIQLRDDCDVTPLIKFEDDLSGH